MKILRCWCSNPTGGKLFAINLLFTTKQYKVDNIDNFVYYGKTRLGECPMDTAPNHNDSNETFPINASKEFAIFSNSDTKMRVRFIVILYRIFALGDNGRKNLVRLLCGRSRNDRIRCR